MKKTLLGLLTLLSVHLNAQQVISPKDVIVKLFISTDQRDWTQTEALFNDRVILDYASMNGHPARELTPSDIIETWKEILPGFSTTHHQLGNFMCHIKNDSAHVFCYGTASHFLEDKQGNVWTVVGSYDFDLTRSKEGSWKITAMKFNFKYQDGNTGLPEKALNNSK